MYQSPQRRILREQSLQVSTAAFRLLRTHLSESSCCGSLLWSKTLAFSIHRSRGRLYVTLDRTSNRYPHSSYCIISCEATLRLEISVFFRVSTLFHYAIFHHPIQAASIVIKMFQLPYHRVVSQSN